MADQDDFTFDEQDSDSEEWYEEEPEKKKKGGSRSRTLFLLLLLVALAGGGYYYTMIMPADDDGPAATPKVVVNVKKKAIAMPVKPKAISKPAPVAIGKTAKVVALPATKPVVAPAAKSAKVAAEPAPLSVQKKQVPTPMPAKVADQPAPAKPAVESKKVFEAPAESKPVKVAMAAKGPYSLTVGTYLLASSVKGVSKKIRAFGYEPVITPVKRKITMTRLKVGTYSKADALAKMAELKTVAPGVFSLKKGNMVSVYVGSYLILDKARRFADTLFKSGIKLIEEPVQIEKILQRVTFGAFASADAAGEVGRQASSKGIEAKVYKNR